MTTRRLPPCPRRPNCVSSQATDSSQRVPPLPCLESCERTLKRLATILRSTPGVRIVEDSPPYLRAEFTTAIFRFVDDLELLADSQRGVIDVRSASRVGTWDLGTNRRRVESLRQRLLQGRD